MNVEAQFNEPLHYKPKSRGFDTRRYHELFI